MVSISFRECNHPSFLNQQELLLAQPDPGWKSSPLTWMACVSLELIRLVPAVFSVYGKLCSNMRCPSFDNAISTSAKWLTAQNRKKLRISLKDSRSFCWQNDNIFLWLALQLWVMVFLLLKWCTMFWNWTFYIELTDLLGNFYYLPVLLSLHFGLMAHNFTSIGVKTY